MDSSESGPPSWKRTTPVFLDDMESNCQFTLWAYPQEIASLAISELLRAQETIESLLDEVEAGQGAELADQKERAERGFREGRGTPWHEVKKQNGL